MSLRAAATWVVVPLLCLTLQACDPDAAETDEPPAVDVTTASDCRALVPESVVAGLGWAVVGAPTLDAGACSITASQGQLSVRRLPVEVASSDDLAAATEQAFEERCAVLDDGAPAGPAEWIGFTNATCAVLSDDGAGVNVLVVQARPDLLVEVSVYPTMPTPLAAVQQALTDLEQAAAERL